MIMHIPSECVKSWETEVVELLLLYVCISSSLSNSSSQVDDVWSLGAVY